MSDMSRANFILTYDGSGLKDHTMNVRDLAPAMLAVGELFDAMNLIVNGEKADIKVNVKAHEPGCFSVVFDILQSWSNGITSLLTGDLVTAALNLKELLIGALGIIYFIKKYRGRMPDKVEKLENNMVRISFDSNSYDVPVDLLRLYQDLSIRTALEKVVYQPLQNEGIELVEFGERTDPTHQISISEAPYFKAPDLPEKILVEDTRVAAYSIISLAFKEDNKWRLHDGSNSVSATIEDVNFLKKVDDNRIRFAKGDVLVCEVNFSQKQTSKGLVTEHVVKKVKKHIPAARQIELPIESSDNDT